MTNSQHQLILPLAYIDRPWNHDFYVACSCGWVDARISHDADTRGHSFPDLHQRAANVVANHALELTLFAMLIGDHARLHVKPNSAKHITYDHYPVNVTTYLYARSLFYIACSCGKSILCINRKYLSPNNYPNYTTRNLATALRRQFYGHCYADNTDMTLAQVIQLTNSTTQGAK